MTVERSLLTFENANVADGHLCTSTPTEVPTPARMSVNLDDFLRKGGNLDVDEASLLTQLTDRGGH